MAEATETYWTNPCGEELTGRDKLHGYLTNVRLSTFAFIAAGEIIPGLSRTCAQPIEIEQRVTGA